MTEGTEEIRRKVAENYGSIARGVLNETPNSCCSSDGGGGGEDPITRDLYSNAEADEVPADAVTASLGCGNPTALVDLHEGETVLDLGSGGGIDVLLSARRVGETGFAYGLDMTDEMLALARKNQAEADVTNVEFLKGHIEEIPLPDNSVDVIISNCVINLSADKPRVFAEALRVLRPGGRFAVSDVVVKGGIDPEIRRNFELWIGCVAGALEESEYLQGLIDAGFADVGLEPTRVYEVDEARDFLKAAGIDLAKAEAASGKIYSAFVRATKPS